MTARACPGGALWSNGGGGHTLRTMDEPAPDPPADMPPADGDPALRAWWLQAQAGDEAAYRQALTHLAGRLRRYFRRRLGPAADEAEDLVQETLLALHLKRGSYDPAWPVEAWALAIARHKLADAWRAHARRSGRQVSWQELDEDAWPAPEDPSPAQRDLARLMDGLPPAQRQAIVLTKVEGLSVAEAALRAGATESAIKVQVHRGLKRLAAWVKERGR